MLSNISSMKQCEIGEDISSLKIEIVVKQIIIIIMIIIIIIIIIIRQ